MTVREVLLLSLVATLGSLAGNSAHAQETPPSAGSLLRELREPPPVPREPSATVDVAPEPRPAIRAAPGLQLDVTAFRVTGLSVIAEDEVLALLEAYRGPGRSFDDLEAAAKAVEDRLRDDGYLLAQAYLPAQKVENGVVEIAVLEGRIGRVRVEGGDGVPVSQSVVGTLLAALPPGTVIRDDTVERALFLTGDLRGLEVRSVLQPGAMPGTADLVLNLAPAPRFGASLDLDNFGSRFTGEHRLGAAFEWNSPFERGDLLAARVLRSSGGRLTFGRASYLAPLGSFGSKIGAAYSTLDYRLGTSEFRTLDAGGSAEVKSVFVLHPFIRGRNLNLFGTFGFDHRKLLDEFVALNLVNERVLDVGVFTLVGDSRDLWLGGGINTFSVSYTTGRVEIRSALQRTIDASAIGRQTAGRYNRLNLGFSRLQQIDDTHFAFFSVSGQWASKNLDSSEKQSLGGPGAVRAYAEGEASSDSALLLTAELRKRLDIPASFELPGYVIGSLFFDIAHGHLNERPLLTDTGNSPTLAGVGVGLRWGEPGDFLLNATAAWRLTDRPRGDPRDRSPRLFFSLSKTF